MKLHDVSKLFQQYQSMIYNLKLVNPLIYRQIVSYREEGHVNDLLKKRKKKGTKIGKKFDRIFAEDKF